LIRWSPILSHFHQKIIHSTFTSGDDGLNYFKDFNVIPSRFDGSKNMPKLNGKFRRATEIIQKNEGLQLLHPPLFKG